LSDWTTLKSVVARSIKTIEGKRKANATVGWTSFGGASILNRATI
jgi:hypothetical protein